MPWPYRTPVALDAHASKSHDGSQLSVRVVNPLNCSVTASVVISGDRSSSSGFKQVAGSILTSASRLDDNSPAAPTRVSPKVMAVVLLGAGGGKQQTAPIEFPPNSLVSLTLQQAIDTNTAAAPAQRVPR